MDNTRNATPETGETADRKPASANPGSPSARLAGYSWVKRATTGASIAMVIGIALVLARNWQDTSAVRWAGTSLFGIALAAWTVIFGVTTFRVVEKACRVWAKKSNKRPASRP